MLLNFINIDYILMLLLVTILGSVSLCYGVYKLILLFEYDKVESECVESYSKADDIGYSGSYKFDYKGKEIVASDLLYRKGLVRKNKKYNSYVNPRNPQEIISMCKVHSYIFYSILGTLLLFLSIFIFMGIATLV